MAFLSFHELISLAKKGNFAVGYFESWNLESLLAVYDAAESMKSPVIMGFNGTWLASEKRYVRDPLELYAGIVRQACESISVPACSIFNESPYLDVVLQSIQQGYGIVMYTDENLSYDQLVKNVETVVRKARRYGVSVEGELAALPGVLELVDDNADLERNLNFTDPVAATDFVKKTEIDALAVNIGQAHFHGRQKFSLDIERLKKIKSEVEIPLVLHAGSYLSASQIKAAVDNGIRKINVGSILKQVYLKSLGKSMSGINKESNPYKIVGSGLKDDIMAKARVAIMEKVKELMHLYGSAGKA
ncbi:MAG: class II fructose-bisphosphate aldolase [Actinobacteria bacterium]|nr:class II fructose-bisphosphate aldolase [Actinomycetota bacterium]